VRPEKEGLRITLPVESKHWDRVGVQLGSRVSGDVEITASYEILEIGVPIQGHGVGIELFVETDSPRQVELGLLRVSRTGEGEVYLSSVSPLENGKRQYFVHSFEATARVGRLRITRIGSKATLSVAEGSSAELRPLCQEELGAEPLRRVRIASYLGHQPNMIDLLIKDLRVRSVPPTEAAALATPPKPARRGWWVAGGVIALVLGATGLAGWLLVRRKRRNQPQPEITPEAVRPEGPTASVSFPCPGCKKKLRAKTALAGKAVKCPECGAAAVVPSIQVNAPPEPAAQEPEKRSGR
jgi:hypothetical protein